MLTHVYDATDRFHKVFTERHWRLEKRVVMDNILWAPGGWQDNWLDMKAASSLVYNLFKTCSLKLWNFDIKLHPYKSS